MKFLSVFVIFAAISFSSFAEDMMKDPKYDSIKSKDAKVFESEDTILFSIEEDMVQYYIAKPSHPAFPYMIKNKVLGRNEHTRFEATGYGEASNDDTEAWLTEIDRANEDKMRILKQGY